VSRAALFVAAAVLLVCAGAPAASGPGIPVEPKLRIAGGALKPADVNGAKVSEQGYEQDLHALSRYERDFGAVKYGKTDFSYVESTVLLYASDLDASLTFASIQAGFSPTAKSLAGLASTFSRTTGITVTSTAIRRKQQFALPGTTGYELILRVVTPAGRMDGGYVFMQSGKLVGMLVSLSTPGASIEHADLARLSKAFARRLRAELKRHA
jgi:hypothetical protein